MANKLYEENNIKAIADAIRTKNSSTDTYKVEEMADAVKNLPTGDNTLWEAFMSDGKDKQLTVYDFSELDITELKTYAFYLFQNQKVNNTIILPNTITKVSSYCFYHCEYTTDVKYPSGLTSIDSYAFSGCTSLALTELPSGLTSIGSYAFFKCENIKINKLPVGLTSISTYAFRYCCGLSIVDIPANAGEIKSYTFGNCTGLIKIKVHNTGLDALSFLDCTNITKVWISSNCKYITANSRTSTPFQGCTALTDIYCEASSKPSVWASYWNYTDGSSYKTATVHWGVTEAEFDALDDTTDTTDATVTA